MKIMPDNQNQTATIETSKKFSVNLPDFLRSSLTALFTAISAVVLQTLDVWITSLQTNGVFVFDKVSFLVALKVAVAAWLGDLLRRYLKSSATVVRIKPGLAETHTDDGGDPPPPPPPPPEGTEIPTKPPPTP